MRFIVGSGMSDLMIKRIFDRMDKGSDHLGTMTFSDSSLAYQEFHEKVSSISSSSSSLSGTVNAVGFGVVAAVHSMAVSCF